MANTIGSLVIDLVANTAQFSTDLKSAVKTVEDGVGKIKDAFALLGGVFASAGIAELTLETIQFGDELSKAAVKTNTGANAISELAFAARQANVDLPELVSSLDKMEKSISSAATGTGKSNAAFEALGISLDQIRKLSPDQQFAEIANQINKLKDPTDKARAAIELFGRAGADMLPLFAEGAEGIAKAREQAVQFGQSFDSDQLKKLSDASDSVRNLKESFSALATAATATIAGPLAKFFDSITNIVTGNKAGLLTVQIEQLQERLNYAQASTGDQAIVKQIQGEILKAEIALQAVKAAKSIQDELIASNAGALLDSKAPGYTPDVKPILINPNYKIRIDSLKKFYDDLDAATQTGTEKLFSDTAAAQAKLDVLVNDGIITLSDSFNRIRQLDPQDAKSLSAFFTTNAAEIASSIKETEDNFKESFVAMSADAKTAQTNMRQQFEETARSAADTGRAITDTFAQAFLNIGQGGLKGLVANFVKAFATILAQAEALDLARALGISKAFENQGGSTALGGIFSGIANLFGGGGSTDVTFNNGAGTASLLGFASGGQFAVGGNGGTDSQLVQFRASPNETVTVTPPGQRAGGGIVFSPTYNIGSGVSRSDVISACQTTQKTTIAQISRLIKGGAYA